MEFRGDGAHLPGVLLSSEVARCGTIVPVPIPVPVPNISGNRIASHAAQNWISKRCQKIVSLGDTAPKIVLWFLLCTLNKLVK